jgi:broad specificity phosphatase PhoE
MDVILARHAEPDLDAFRTFRDGGLSARGREQARALGRALEPIGLRRCLVSPLERAEETARIALASRPVPIETCADVAEGSLGALQGLTREEALRRFPADLRLGHSVVARIAASGRTAPEGESRDAFLARARRACTRVLRELAEEGGPALVVSHGGLLNYLLQLLLGLPLRDEPTFGFEFCGTVRVLSYTEHGAHGAAGLGPCPALRFGSAAGDSGAADPSRRP